MIKYCLAIVVTILALGNLHSAEPLGGRYEFNLSGSRMIGDLTVDNTNSIVGSFYQYTTDKMEIYDRHYDVEGWTTITCNNQIYLELTIYVPAFEPDEVDQVYILRGVASEDGRMLGGFGHAYRDPLHPMPWTADLVANKIIPPFAGAL